MNDRESEESVSPMDVKKGKDHVENAIDAVGSKLHDAGRKAGSVARSAERKVATTASSVGDAAWSNAPAIVGAGLGGLAGYLDGGSGGDDDGMSLGAVVACALLGLQLLEHERVVSLPWNRGCPPSHHEGHQFFGKLREGRVGSAIKALWREAKEFAGNNAGLAAGFSGGYVLGYLVGGGGGGGGSGGEGK